MTFHKESKQQIHRIFVNTIKGRFKNNCLPIREMTKGTNKGGEAPTENLLVTFEFQNISIFFLDKLIRLFVYSVEFFQNCWEFHVLDFAISTKAIRKEKGQKEEDKVEIGLSRDV